MSEVEDESLGKKVSTTENAPESESEGESATNGSFDKSSSTDASESPKDATASAKMLPVSLSSELEEGELSESDDKEKELKEFLRSRPLIPEVREVNFEQFKNRYGRDDGLHIIEVLRATPNIGNEIKEESNSRMFSQSRDKDTMKFKTGSGTDGSWLQRVRIQSPPVLAHLHQVAEIGPRWDFDIPRTFFRPFNAIRYFQPHMKKTLQDLETEWAEIEELDRSGKHEEAAAKEVALKKYSERAFMKDVNQKSSDKTDQNRRPELIGITALRHMRCYVDFVDKNIMVLESMFKDMTRKKVRFNDLALLFKPGDVVCAQPSRSVVTIGQQNYQATYKVYHTSRSSYRGGTPDDIVLDKSDKFSLCSYYIDYDGTSYGRVKVKININQYHGWKSITELPVYPIRYVENEEALRNELQDQGRRFCGFIREKHLYYDGWTISSTPRNYDDKEKDESPPSHSEYVESAVILDFSEAFKHHSDWIPKMTSISRRNENWDSSQDDLGINHWSSKTKRKLWTTIEENTQTSEAANDRLKNDYVDSDTFIMGLRAGEVKILEDDNLIFLPRRIVAYALRERRFIQVDVLSLRHIVKQPRIFQDLKINPSHKRMVRSLVKAHFKTREIQKARPQIQLNQDLIRGKGSGLFILLHGAPGVGKTATAEAIAQSNNKPLFSITCGDLGLTPREVEAELKEIFRLAHLWDCVLLLDEADIFLTRRDMVHLKRNALVSVFLRVLEYYSGILFLTTNRVGHLDEAFKSRIHVSLYYERLSLNQTMAIFDINIRKLIDMEEERSKELKGTSLDNTALKIDEPSIREFARSHFLSHSEDSRWNGRQIRNAFQIASSLARYDIQKGSLEGRDDERQKNPSKKARSQHEDSLQLDKTQFQMVADVIEGFDTYFQLATGTTDEEAALLEGLRDDKARIRDLTPARPVYATNPVHGGQSYPNAGLSRRRTGFEQEARYQERYYEDDIVQSGSSRKMSVHSRQAAESHIVGGRGKGSFPESPMPRSQRNQLPPPRQSNYDRAPRYENDSHYDPEGDYDDDEYDGHGTARERSYEDNIQPQAQNTHSYDDYDDEDYDE